MTLTLLLLSSLALAQTPADFKPRKDLATAVETATPGLSLRKVARAVIDDDTTTGSQLRIAASKVDADEVKREFTAEREAAQKRCRIEKRTEESCAEELKVVADEEKSIIDRMKSAKSLPDKKDAGSLATATSLFYFGVKTKIVDPALAKWSHDCPGAKGIEDAACTRKLDEIRHFDFTVRDLVILAQSKASKRPVAPEFAKELNERIASYEK